MFKFLIAKSCWGNECLSQKLQCQFSKHKGWVWTVPYWNVLERQVDNTLLIKVNVEFQNSIPNGTVKLDKTDKRTKQCTTGLCHNIDDSWVFLLLIEDNIACTLSTLEQLGIWSECHAYVWKCHWLLCLGFGRIFCIWVLGDCVLNLWPVYRVWPKG